MEQLSLNFPVEAPSSHRVCMLKDGKELLSLSADSLAEAQSRRRSLVTVLQRDPRNRTVWEDVPRSTGWWGLRPEPPHGSAVYNVIIESA